MEILKTEIRTHVSREYAINQEEEAVLERAAKILDKLYADSQEDSIWKMDFQKARDSLVFLLDNLDFNGGYSYWSESVAETQ